VLDKYSPLCYNINCGEYYIMILYTNTRSRKKKATPKKKAAEYQDWLKKVQSTSTNFSGKSVRKHVAARKASAPSIPIDRNVRTYPSLSSEHFDTFKKKVNQYTGDKMLGIGTLHKSNAVPIFNEQDAKDQANMRR